MKYLQLKLAEFLSRLLPRRIGYGLARRLADIYVFADRRGRECVMANLQHIHQHSGVSLPLRSQRALARENFLNFAKYLVDFFHFLHVKPARAEQLLHFGNVRETIDALLAEGRGIIFLSAHLGNWELGAAAIASLGYKVNAVALWQPDPKLNRLYQRYRTSRCIHPIAFGRAARDCIAALRRNEIIALVGDRDFTTSRDTVEFFGRPARLPTGPAKLALTTGAPVLPIFLIRLPDDTFEYVLDEPIRADRARDTAESLTRRIAVSLERVISQHSEQWFLFHNPWDIEEDRALVAKMTLGAPAGNNRVVVHE